jgi:hypothetical protein
MIAANARQYATLTNAQAEAQEKTWRRLLRLRPEDAAEAIARAIERRDKRLVIGDDAKRAALIQRLFPVTYWQILKRAT